MSIVGCEPSAVGSAAGAAATRHDGPNDSA